MSTLTGVAFDARYAFVSDDKGAVHALDRSNGRSVWKQDRLAYRQLSLPLPLGTEVAVGDLQGYVHFLARESGAFVGRVATDGSAMRAAPHAAGRGRFLVQTAERRPVRAATPAVRRARVKPVIALVGRPNVGKSHAVQPPDAAARRDRRRRARRDARPPLRRGPARRPLLHRHRHRRAGAAIRETGIYAEMARQTEQAIVGGRRGDPGHRRARRARARRPRDRGEAARACKERVWLAVNKSEGMDRRDRGRRVPRARPGRPGRDLRRARRAACGALIEAVLKPFPPDDRAAGRGRRSTRASPSSAGPTSASPRWSTRWSARSA